MVIILLCGYRRTGKDTLYTILSNKFNNQDEIAITNKFKWKIYKHPNKINEQFSDASKKYKRVAFADLLKNEVSSIYGIPSIIPDSEKDIKQFKHFKTGDFVSARDIYVEWGLIRRSGDINYWSKAVINLMEKENNYIITDWRYRNESDYILNAGVNNVLTVRMYRSDVPEPDITIESEHNLDNYQTDFLLLRDDIEGEYKKIVKKFPQYQGYIQCESI